MLRETYRSCDGIAGYSNEVFYKGQLRVATDESKLVLPAGTKPGIHWTDVEGVVRSAGKSGCVCEEEIEAVYDLVEALLVKNNFRGTIGVVTPFRIQANRLNDRIFEGDIPYAQLTNAQVVIDTSHGFQGDEKDVMIFSLCGGRDMPQGSRHFLGESANLFNVAVSRARAVLHVVGNRKWAINSSIPHIVSLAAPQEEKSHSPKSSPWAPYESPWEKKLAEALIAKGLSPKPQYPLAGRRLDLALVDKSRGIYLDIEVDGDQYHRNPDGSRKNDDLWRDITIQGRGWRVMRFWVYRLKESMNECVAEIEKAWNEHEREN
jgi:very-short-patch-repair endonuclease